MVGKVFVFVLLVFPHFALANSQATEEWVINRLLVHNGNENNATSQRVRVGLAGAIKNSTCASTGDWVITLNNEASKSQYSMLLASYVSGKTVSLTGNLSGGCISGQEVIRNVEVN